MTVILNDTTDFNLESLRRVAWKGETVQFGNTALSRMRIARERFLNMVETVPDLHIYGVTTGFGDGASTILSKEGQAKLAKAPNFVRNTGVGEAMPGRAIRAMIFTRLINYTSGYAAISMETAQAVADMLDGRPLPDVRVAGMDSAGEVLQLITLYAHLMGDMSLARDQNALRNGTGCAPGLLGDTALRARRRTRIAGAVYALSIDAASLNMDPWDRALKSLIQDPHEGEAIDLLNGYLDGMKMEGRRSWQPPISWRILTRMLGHMLRTVALLEQHATMALSAINDNPVYLDEEQSPPHGRVISSGGFHVPYAYHPMNWMTATWADLAAITARETEQIHKKSVTGLPDRLWVDDNRYSTAFLSVSGYDLARRAAEHANPALIPLYSGSDGQTDTIMPLFSAYEKEMKAARCYDLCLAMLAASASQALAVAGREPAPALRPILAEVRAEFPVVTDARNLGADVEHLADAFSAAILAEREGFGLID